MKLKKFLGDASAYLIPILLIGLWIIGAFHGNKKHNVDPFSSNFFVCWYYGLETMWHKIDYKELNDDIKVAAFLIMQKPTGIDAKEQLEFNETKKALKKILKSLDTKEINYIKSGINTFVGFIESFQDDMIAGFINYKASKLFNPYFTDKTKNLSKKCSSFGLEEEMKEMDAELEKIKNKFKEKAEKNLNDLDEGFLDEKKMRDEAKQRMNIINSTVKEIFIE